MENKEGNRLLCVREIGVTERKGETGKPEKVRYEIVHRIPMNETLALVAKSNKETSYNICSKGAYKKWVKDVYKQQNKGKSGIFRGSRRMINPNKVGGGNTKMRNSRGKVKFVIKTAQFFKNGMVVNTSKKIPVNTIQARRV